MWLNRIPMHRGRLITAVLAAMVTLAGASIARAQAVVALVDGVPITQLDIIERGKLEQLSTQKLPPRQEVLDTLIDEILEVKEAKRFEIDVPQTEVDNSYATVAQRMGDRRAETDRNAGACGQQRDNRSKAGFAPNWPGPLWSAAATKRALKLPTPTSKPSSICIRAIKNRMSATSIRSARSFSSFRRARRTALYESRKREADALRARFAELHARAFTFARALTEVAVRDQVIKFSADLPQQLREILDGTEIGHLTPPETHRRGRADVRRLRQTADQKRNAGEARRSATKCSSRNSAPRPTAYLQRIAARGHDRIQDEPVTATQK